MVESSDNCGPLEKTMGNHFSILALRTPRMASGPITPWEIDGETVESVSDFILLGSKITADGTAAMKLKDAYSLQEKL